MEGLKGKSYKLYLNPHKAVDKIRILLHKVALKFRKGKYSVINTLGRKIATPNTNIFFINQFKVAR